MCFGVDGWEMEDESFGSWNVLVEFLLEVDICVYSIILFSELFLGCCMKWVVVVVLLLLLLEFDVVDVVVFFVVVFGVVEDFDFVFLVCFVIVYSFDLFIIVNDNLLIVVFVFVL